MTVGNNWDICALFTDGGLIGSNPSPKGGTWAWCGVSKDGEHVREVSGYLLTKGAPEGAGNPRVRSDVVANNDSEWYAAMRALEAMPEGWSGILASDSSVTLSRLQKIRDGEFLRTFRMDWWGRANRAFGRLGKVQFVQLAGHPTKKQLEDGYKLTEDGQRVKVSRHQVWCDSACSELAKTYDSRVVGWQTYVAHGLPGLEVDAA